MIRAAIRRWLGVPSYLEARAITLAEMDADTVWKSPPSETGLTASAERRELRNVREVAIRLGYRENPGA